MPVYLHAARTIVPETSYTQDEAGEVMLRSLDPESRAGRLVRRIYRHSGIEKRHSVIRDLKKPADGNLFFSKEGKFLSPSTGTRNDVYARESRPLFVAAAKAAIDARGHFALAVPGGSVAKALAGLKDAKGIDWEKVHVFFVNERVPDGKCFKLACETWASGAFSLSVFHPPLGVNI